jgi:hypothetical protein
VRFRVISWIVLVQNEKKARNQFRTVSALDIQNQSCSIRIPRYDRSRLCTND